MRGAGARDVARRTAYLTVVVALLVTGCSGTEPPAAPSDPAVTPGEWDGPMSREEYLTELAEIHGIEDPPPVEVVEEIAPDADGLRLIAECYAEHGWPATFDGDGITIEGIPPEQQEAFDLDRYVCDAQYPVAEKYRSLSPEEHLRRWYAYLTTTYVPCVEALGYDISEPPTLETFLASGGQTWIPNAQVGDQTRARGEDFRSVDEQCPQQMPPEMREP